jgi:hypothetical protein
MPPLTNEQYQEIMGTGCDARDARTLEPRSFFADPLMRLVSSERLGASCVSTYAWGSDAGDEEVKSGEVELMHAAGSDESNTYGTAAEGKDTTGLTIWPAALSLCEWLLRRSTNLLRALPPFPALTASVATAGTAPCLLRIPVRWLAAV